jgi:hypothetical protein
MDEGMDGGMDEGLGGGMKDRWMGGKTDGWMEEWRINKRWKYLKECREMNYAQ